MWPQRPAETVEPIITRFVFGTRGGAIRGGVNSATVAFAEVPRETAEAAAAAFAEVLDRYLEVHG